MILLMSVDGTGGSLTLLLGSVVVGLHHVIICDAFVLL